MISFIVPAYNEQMWIGTCLASIEASMAGIPEPYEVVVVDDASTDDTSSIAKQSGARVIHVEQRKISAVRNAGARAAGGDVLFFIDADTRANSAAVTAALDSLRQGAVGGGCVPRFDGPVPIWGRAVIQTCVWGARLLRLVGGCFLFCTRNAFEATGGFSERLYAGEDIEFVRALKKIGPFVVPKPAVVTSGRKLAVVNPWQVVGLLMTIAVRGAHYERPWVIDILYGGRAQESRQPGSAYSPNGSGVKP
jgi:glycosyltransferase involved in cell wall biosynthesis